MNKPNENPATPPAQISTTSSASSSGQTANAARSGIKLDGQLKWKSASEDEKKMLENLQGNILKGHGRDRTWNIFFKFEKNDPAKAKRALREIGNRYVTNAFSQLLKAEKFKTGGFKSEVQRLLMN